MIIASARGLNDGVQGNVTNSSNSATPVDARLAIHTVDRAKIVANCANGSRSR